MTAVNIRRGYHLSPHSSDDMNYLPAHFLNGFRRVKCQLKSLFSIDYLLGFKWKHTKYGPKYFMDFMARWKSLKLYNKASDILFLGEKYFSLLGTFHYAVWLGEPSLFQSKLIQSTLKYEQTFSKGFKIQKKAFSLNLTCLKIKLKFNRA